MESKGRIKGIATRNQIILELDIMDGLQEIGLEEDLKITIRKWRKPRTHRANAYMWELIGKLSIASGIPAVDIYKEFIRRSGKHHDIWVNPEDVESVILQESDVKASGTGNFAERNVFGDCGGKACITVYEGSSRYDTLEFSLLVTDIVQECKDAGIETLTPNEILEMEAIENAKQ